MRHTIYYIENEANLKGYVGVTNGSPETRFVGHVADATQERTDSTLHKAIRKYGRDSFVVIPLDVASAREEALELEKEWISKLDTCHGPGYNDDEGGGEPPHAYGENHHGAKLDSESVWEMRNEYASNPRTSFDKIADKRGLNRATVADAINGETWRDVPIPDGIEEAKNQTSIKKSHPGEQNASAELSDAEVEEMRVKYEETSITQTELAEEYDTHQGHVTKIVNGKARRGAGGPTKEAQTILSDEEVRELRTRYQNQESLSQRELADEYDIGRGHISVLLSGKRRRDAGGPTSTDNQHNLSGEEHPTSKLTDRGIRAIRDEYDEGEVTYLDLAEKHDVSKSYIGHIITGRTRTEAGGPIQ